MTFFISFANINIVCSIDNVRYHLLSSMNIFQSKTKAFAFPSSFTFNESFQHFHFHTVMYSHSTIYNIFFCFLAITFVVVPKNLATLGTTPTATANLTGSVNLTITHATTKLAKCGFLSTLSAYLAVHFQLFNTADTKSATVRFSVVISVDTSLA